MKPAMTEIIVVKYNLRGIEDQCIRAVLDHTDNYNLTVFDNYPKNHNLGQLWNRLISKSEAEYICLLNNDALVTPFWLDKLLEAFGKHPKVGVVGGTTNSSHNQQSTDHTAKTFVDFGRTYPGWCLSGFCLVFPKKVWEEVGGFPEDFGFYGQEVAFIDRLTEKGYKQCWRTDVFIYHYGSASVKKAQANGDIDEIKERKIAHEKFTELRKKNENKNIRRRPA